MNSRTDDNQREILWQLEKENSRQKVSLMTFNLFTFYFLSKAILRNMFYKRTSSPPAASIQTWLLLSYPPYITWVGLISDKHSPWSQTRLLLATDTSGTQTWILGTPSLPGLGTRSWLQHQLTHLKYFPKRKYDFQPYYTFTTAHRFVLEFRTTSIASSIHHTRYYFIWIVVLLQIIRYRE